MTSFKYTFLVTLMVLCAFLACKNTEQSSNVYVPSEEILAALEKGEDGLKVCETVQDSFYVGLEIGKRIFSENDTIKSLKQIGIIEKQLPRISNNLLISRYYYFNAKLQTIDSMKLNSLKKSVDLIEIAGAVDEGSLTIYKHYSDLIESQDLDLSIKYAELVEMNYRDSLSEIYLDNKLLLAQRYSRKLHFEEALKLRIELVAKRELNKSLNPKKYIDALNALSISYYDLHEIPQAITIIEKALDHADKYDAVKEHLLKNLITYLINSYEFEKVEIRISELEEIANSDLLKFDVEKLKGLLYFNKADDIKSSMHNRKAIQISESIEISEAVWLDVRLILTRSLIFLNKLNEADDIIKEVGRKYNLADSRVVFNDLNLLEFKIADLENKVAVALVENSERSLLAVNKVIDDFLVELDYYVSSVKDENATTIYELCFEIYDAKFSVLLKLHELNPDGSYDQLAFQENEKLKAKSIFVKKLIKGLSDKLEFQRLVKSELALRAKLLNSEGLTSEELTSNDELNRILDSIKVMNELFYTLRYTEDNSYYELVKRYCTDNQVNIIEYFSGIGVYFGMLINEDGIVLKEIDISMYDYFYKLGGLDVFKHQGEFDTLSKEIYKVIFKPFEKDLKGSNIIVISDGIVDCVSFDSFISDLTQDYLVNNYEINYAYSLKNLLIQSENDWKFSEKIDVLAYSFTDEETIKEKSNLSLNEIIGGYNECMAMKTIFKNKNISVITGSEATKDHFYKNSRNKDIVHLALHGEGEESSIRNNKLYFRNTNKIEYIESADLRFFENDIGLIFLNACETNKAKNIINEGSMSIARSFAESGVANIITSSWDIDDESSYKIVVSFYKELISGKDPSMALLAAKRKFIRENKKTPQAHPVYWGALSFYMN